MYESTPYNYEFRRICVVLPRSGVEHSDELQLIPLLGQSIEQRAVIDELGYAWTIYNVDGVEFSEDECHTMSHEDWVRYVTRPENIALSTLTIDPAEYRDYLDGLQRLDYPY